MDHQTTLIYLMDQDTLGQLHDGWPDGMRVALCLTEEGESNVALIHEDEVDEAPARISELFGLDDEDFVIVPRLGGYPTRRISFGEEQQLCGIVADIAGLPAIARGFLEEYEGELEADALPQDPEPEPVPVVTEAVLPDPIPVEPPAPEPVTPEPVAAEPGPVEPPVALPPGFRQINPEECQRPAEVRGHLVRAGSRIRFRTRETARRSWFRKPFVPQEVGVSEDQLALCLLLPEKAGKSPFRTGVEIPWDALPLAWHPGRKGKEVRAVLDEDGQRLTLTAVIARAKVRTPVRTKKPARGRSSGLASGLAAHAFGALIVFSMVQIGISETAQSHMRGGAEAVAYWDSGR